jgi:isocitrate/isopropylmalate dehydrogenase
MKPTLSVLEAAGARIDIEMIEIGEAVYSAAIRPASSPRRGTRFARTKVSSSARSRPRKGAASASLNVTVRKALGLYRQRAPCVAYHPFVAYKHPVMDVVIVRENEEDLYAGSSTGRPTRSSVPEAHHRDRAARRSSATPSSTRANKPQEGHLLHQRTTS